MAGEVGNLVSSNGWLCEGLRLPIKVDHVVESLCVGFLSTYDHHVFSNHGSCMLEAFGGRISMDLAPFCPFQNARLSKGVLLRIVLPIIKGWVLIHYTTRYYPSLSLAKPLPYQPLIREHLHSRAGSRDNAYISSREEGEDVEGHLLGKVEEEVEGSRGGTAG